MRYCDKYLIMLLFCLLSQALAFGQDPGGNLLPDRSASFRIEYQQQFTYENETRGSRLSEIILGKEEPMLLRPVSVSAAGIRDFWVADQERGVILRQHGDEISEIPLQKSKVQTFPSLVASCLLPGGILAFTDSRLNQVWIYDPGRKAARLLNTSLVLDRPTGIAYAAAGNELWISETGKHRLVVLDMHGNLLRTAGVRGGGPGEFNFPTHLCVDQAGNILVVDAMNYRIQTLDPHGNYLSMFGEHGDASGFLASPKGIATDSYGHIYVADALFHVIQVFDHGGHFLSSFGSKGSGEGQFWMPSGICIDEENHIYVSDTYNKRIQVFRLEE